MNTLQTLMRDKAGLALQVPGVIALQPGVRIRAGRKQPDAPSVVALVERKVAPQDLAQNEDLRNLFGAESVDVVEATPLQLLFARPAQYGIDAEDLAELEDRFGYPFSPQAIGVQPLRLMIDARKAAVRRGEISYEPPEGVELEPLRGRIKLRCHSGPDSGWQELQTFLLATERELVVGMYDLSAPHIGDLLAGPVANRAEEFRLVLDNRTSIGSGVKKHDREEEEHAAMFAEAFGDGFSYAYALTSGPNQTFESHYHIKLAVRDRQAFWMSSGSWQSSNQPNLDPLGPDRDDPTLPEYNREWHVIGEQAELSEVWAKFLDGDLETAQSAVETPDFRAKGTNLRLASAPFVFVRDRETFPYETFFLPQEFAFEAGDEYGVLPLLTPDNYIEHVSQLVVAAENELLVQNQSLNFLKEEADQDPRFTAFVALLARRSHELAAFSLILRDPAEHFGSRAAKLTELEGKGFDISKVRFQVGCHNKGFLADRTTVLIGSHNMTNAGMTTNRDASLIIRHPEIAEYFRAIFMHDWKVAGMAPAAPPMRLAVFDELPPPGYQKRTLWELLDDD